ncbi:hypothetical protein [Bradyrhizobium sp. CCBAU 53421]|nr:hypothetical protein [Bradyrhizobium sp. CCBAU 53421]
MRQLVCRIVPSRGIIAAFGLMRLAAFGSMAGGPPVGGETRKLGLIKRLI